MWGKRRNSKTTRAWRFKSTIKKAPSKRRPATRKKWVAKVTRLTFPDVKRHLRPPSNKGSRNMPEEKRDWVISEGDPFPKTPIERWDANICVIKLSRQLEKEGRSATREEQRDVAKYSGLGYSAFEQAFSHCGARDPAWQKRRAELEELVSDEQLEGIRRSRINTFYTTPEIVRGMRKGLSDMGVDKLDSLNVLEPSAGSDRFLGLRPRRTAMKSERTAVEPDPMTADILKHLYPETKVYTAGIQEAPISDNRFGIAISSVPFGKVKVYDPEFNASGREFLTGPVHNYFFAKTLDKLRPGGVMAYITSHHTMDAPSAKAIRGYLADRADLPGVARQPGDAFPDTDVTTDIIYLRKRAEGDPPSDDGWVETKKVSAKDKLGFSEDVDINNYYVDNPDPDRVLGKHSAAGSMYRGREYTVKSDPSIPVVPTLNREMREMAENLGPDALRPQRTVPYERPEDFSKAQRKRRPERLVLEDGQLRLSDGTSSRKSSLPAEDIQRIAALMSLRHTARKLVTMEAEDGDNDEVERTRAALRQQYDNYVADQNGEAINTSTNRKLLVAGADGSLADQSFDVTNRSTRRGDDNV